MFVEHTHNGVLLNVSYTVYTFIEYISAIIPSGQQNNKAPNVIIQGMSGSPNSGQDDWVVAFKSAWNWHMMMLSRCIVVCYSHHKYSNITANIMEITASIDYTEKSLI